MLQQLSPPVCDGLSSDRHIQSRRSGGRASARKRILSEENQISRTCPCCGQPAKLVAGAEMYPLRPSTFGNYYYACHGYIADCAPGTTHQITPLATYQLRRARHETERAFKAYACKRFARRVPNGFSTTEVALERAAADLCADLGRTSLDFASLTLAECHQIYKISIEWLVETLRNESTNAKFQPDRKRRA